LIDIATPFDEAASLHDSARRPYFSVTDQILAPNTFAGFFSAAFESPRRAGGDDGRHQGYDTGITRPQQSGQDQERDKRDGLATNGID
jgi:hypothetical protein